MPALSIWQRSPSVASHATRLQKQQSHGESILHGGYLGEIAGFVAFSIEEAPAAMLAGAARSRETLQSPHASAECVTSSSPANEPYGNASTPADALSIAAGKRGDAPASTRLADGMECRVVAPFALSLIGGAIDGVVEVDDDDVARAMKALSVDTHNVAEDAGAASLATAMRLARERPAAIAGKRVGLTLCGANVDHKIFERVLLETPLD